MLLFTLMKVMPREQALKRSIVSQEEQCKEIITEVRKSLDESSPEEAELGRHQGHLEYALENLKEAYKLLQDHYHAQEDVAKEDLDAYYKQKRESLLPLEDLLREVKVQSTPVATSSRSWWPFKLETSTGEIAKFQSFMDNFEATIDMRRDLHDVDKLNICGEILFSMLIYN